MECGSNGAADDAPFGLGVVIGAEKMTKKKREKKKSRFFCGGERSKERGLVHQLNVCGIKLFLVLVVALVLVYFGVFKKK